VYAIRPASFGSLANASEERITMAHAKEWGYEGRWRVVDELQDIGRGFIQHFQESWQTPTTDLVSVDS
jgi:hypothetical protein